MGEAGSVAGVCSQAVKEAFNNMRFIVPVDWLQIGHISWFYILKETFMGEAGGVAGVCSQAVKEAFNVMRFMVPVDWSTYQDKFASWLWRHGLQQAILLKGG